MVHERALTRADFRKRNGHGSLAVWFTGLSGAGKSTIAHGVEEALFRKGWYAHVLDGDHLRHGLNSDLGFSDQERSENIRRAGEVARLFVDAGILVLAAFISPFRADRDRVRALFDPGDFVEIHVRCDLETCASRDPKGLYRKARGRELPRFTGIDSPYEEPEQPELVIDTCRMSPAEAIALVVDYLEGVAGEAS